MFPSNVPVFATLPDMSIQNMQIRKRMFFIPELVMLKKLSNVQPNKSSVPKQTNSMDRISERQGKVPKTTKETKPTKA